ncbi:MAG TPA: hypothetical protein VJN93_14395 [Candidatus Acidoferrum sp.]|nr:hypothetical protein [Candidatus Acidoferrum sp.]
MNIHLQVRKTPRQILRAASALAATFFLGAVCQAQTAPARTAPAQAAPQHQPAEATGFEELNKYPGLLEECGRLYEKLQQQVVMPGERQDSQILPLLPGTTTFYLALPNYGEAASQGLKIFHDELQQSAVLRDWWTHGDPAPVAPKIEQFIDKFSQLHGYLGNEIVISGSAEGKETRILAVAQVRKPGLKKFLDETVAEFATSPKPGVVILDEQSLPKLVATPSKNELLVLVRPDFIIASSDLNTLRNFNTHLAGKSRDFASTAFGQRLGVEYHSGLTVLTGADLHKIIASTASAADSNEKFQESGFAEMKYAIWDHRGHGEQALNQMELSFSAPRHGAAAWLAKPTSLGSLDYVSPKSMFALSLNLTDPSRIFDDIRDMQRTPTTDPLAGVAAFAQILKLDLKGDLLNLLTGEITAELDSISPQPGWRAMLGVRDPAHLQQTLATLFAAAHLEDHQTSDGGKSYYTVRVPSGKTTMDLTYTFSGGYLILGSARDAVVDSIALHQSGASLAKSEKLLATIPPGHSAEASGLFYQDPAALAAIQLQRVSPQYAETLRKFSGNGRPGAMWLYGQEKSIQEMSRSNGVELPVALVVAAVAIPNLLRARTAANESAAVGSVRSVITAQKAYANNYAYRGYAMDLASLGIDPSKPNSPSPEHANFLDATLANSDCAGRGWCLKSGYKFNVRSVCLQGNCTDYVVTATPAGAETGTRTFCATSSGIIHWTAAGSLSEAITAAQCKRWPALQ